MWIGIAAKCLPEAGECCGTSAPEPALRPPPAALTGSRDDSSRSRPRCSRPSPRNAIARAAGITTSGSSLSSAVRSGTSADSSRFAANAQIACWLAITELSRSRIEARRRDACRTACLQERARPDRAPAGRGSSKSGASCSGDMSSVWTLRPQGSSTTDAAAVADAIDSARRVNITNSSSRAMLDVPAARVDHDETAVGGFDDVGRMKIRIVRRDKVLVHCAIRRAVWDQRVTDDLAGVELSGKEIAAHLIGKHRTLITHEPAQRYGRIERERAVVICR